MDEELSSVSFVTDPGLLVPHGFLKRRGGVSTGIYASLNCGLPKTQISNYYESQENILENRRRAVMAIGGSVDQLCLSKQVHGNVCLSITKPFSIVPEADALVTATPGLVLGVRTADCVPVLFHDPVSRIIGVAHAGWRGALAGIIESTVTRMEKLGSHPQNIRAVLGPAIDQASYEVDADFLGAFVALSPDYDRFFMAGKKPGKYFFDLPGFVLQRLLESKVGHVHNMGISTYKNETDFFSCRRAFHKHEPGFGNQLSLIFMKTNT